MPLRKADRVTTDTTGFWIFKEGRIWLSKRLCIRLSGHKYEAAKAAQLSAPVAVAREGTRTLWWYQDSFYWDSDNLDSEAVALLIWEKEKRLGSKLSRLKKMMESTVETPVAKRERVPEDVRLLVWERDGGKCQRCGATEQLQFDHIVPVSKGGGSDPANIELLCSSCNQMKSDSVA